jgi:hypothetical protein
MRGNPIDIAVARVAFVMVNVDENFPMADTSAEPAQALEACAIGGDDAVKFHSALRLLEQSIPIEELVFLRNGIFIPAINFFPFIFERQRQTQLRSDTVAIRPDVPNNANRFAFADDIKNLVDNFWVTFHQQWVGRAARLGEASRRPVLCPPLVRQPRTARTACLAVVRRRRK